MQINLLTTTQAANILGVSKAFLERDRWAGARIPFQDRIACCTLSSSRFR